MNLSMSIESFLFILFKKRFVLQQLVDQYPEGFLFWILLYVLMWGENDEISLFLGEIVHARQSSQKLMRSVHFWVRSYLLNTSSKMLRKCWDQFIFGWDRTYQTQILIWVEIDEIVPFLGEIYHKLKILLSSKGAKRILIYNPNPNIPNTAPGCHRLSVRLLSICTW